MNVIIKKENSSRIESILDEVQKKSRVRKLKAMDILKACEKIKEFYKIPWSELKGSKFMIDLYAQDFSNRYKGTPESTQFKIEAMNGYFKLTDVFRNDCNDSTWIIDVSLSESAKNALLEYLESPGELKKKLSLIVKVYVA